MVDQESYYSRQPDRAPDLMGDIDCKRWSSDCACDTCGRGASYGRRSVATAFEDYQHILSSTGNRKELTRHMYLLCPKKIPAFVFKLRRWGKFTLDVISKHRNPY